MHVIARLEIRMLCAFQRNFLDGRWIFTFLFLPPPCPPTSTAPGVGRHGDLI